MAILTWDNIGDRRFETGVDRCVLYLADITNNVVSYPKGVAWSGITSISESPDGADAEDFYADNIKYLSLRGAENFGGSIGAYTYPDEWGVCDGSAKFGESVLPGVVLHQQKRKTFGLSYRTIEGNDIDGEAGYLYHLVYGATASPSEREYGTVNDSPEPIEFSWDFDTTPVPVTGFEGTLKPTSHITIYSRLLTPAQKTALEGALWGTTGSGGSEGTDAYLPLPGALYTLLTTAT